MQIERSQIEGAQATREKVSLATNVPIREKRREPRYRGSRLQLTDAQSDRVREAYRRAQHKAGSQMALASVLGCSQQSVSGVFSARVSLAMAALLSMHLGVLVADLVGEP